MPANSFLNIFAKSPIKPLEQHIRKVFQATERLKPFFEAVFSKDWDKATEIRQEIADFEKEADVLKRKIRVQLPRGLFLPVDRTDLLELVTYQDKIANKAKDISGRVMGRQLEIPAEVQEEFLTFLERCIQAVMQACKAINEFDELLETGFKGLEADLVENMISKLDAIEYETDALQIVLRRSLLAIESQMNPVDTIFIYQVIDWIGDLADHAERVGSRLELMLAR